MVCVTGILYINMMYIFWYILVYYVFIQINIKMECTLKTLFTYNAFFNFYFVHEFAFLRVVFFIIPLLSFS